MAVFGTAALVVLSVGTVLFFGLGSAMQNTRRLMTDQSQTIVTTLEEGVNRYLSMVDDQADWIAKYIASHGTNSLDSDALDQFLLGTLAATPQVAGIAIVTPDLISRRWTRSTRDRIVEDWSSRPDIRQWLEQGSDRAAPAWNTPFFTDTIDSVVLLRDRPLLSHDGIFLGMLGQIIPVTSLSQQISTNPHRLGITPFILYGKQHVLAHPNLLRDNNHTTTGLPLRTLEDINDPVLQHIWADDNDNVALVMESDNLEVNGRFIDSLERYVIYLYRNIDRFGETPWTVGVHINTDLYGGAENDRLVRALGISLLVMLLASLLAAWLGRRISKPVVAIAQAARQVEQNSLDEITPLKSSTVRELNDASRSINQMVIDLRERALIRETLGRYVPEAVARNLLSEGGELRSQECDATLLYSDIVGFTSLTEALGASGVVDVLNAYFSEMVAILDRYDGVVTQFHGDAILAIFNVPKPSIDHAGNAVLAAKDMLAAVDSKTFSSHNIDVRIGVTTGRVIAGAVGAAGRLSYTVYGDSVNRAARLETMNKTLGTRLLVSEQTATLAKDDDLVVHSSAHVRGQSTDVILYTLRE